MKFIPPSTHNNLIGESLAGYIVDSFISYGKTTHLYRGVHRQSRRPVAIRVQVIPQDDQTTFLKRFFAEKALIVCFDHPYILPLLAYGEVGGMAYTVCPFLADSYSLFDRLSAVMPTYDEVAQIARQIGSALAYAHHRGVVHGGLQPRKILFDDNHNLHVTDFGIPYAAVPVYVPPEAFWESSEDLFSDVYAFGVMIYQMVTGSTPFEADHLQTLIEQILGGNPPLAIRSDDPAGFALDPIIHRAMASDPQDRYDSVEQLARNLETYIHGWVNERQIDTLPERSCPRD